MSNVLHPARVMNFDQLYQGLEQACAKNNVYKRFDQETGRVLYCYTKTCVYDNAWDEFSTLARGLILDPANKQVVATPFPKFFNVGERGRAIPALAFDTYEKVDGSLEIIHYHSGKWRAATKGSFESTQAQWAENLLSSINTDSLDKGTTYLAEALYPENRIVIRYEEVGLVLLGAYTNDGRELTYDELETVGDNMDWRVAKRYHWDSFADLVAHTKDLPATQEGYVLHFSNSERQKLKGDEYCRIHAMISNCTPLNIWESMSVGADMEAYRKDLPEEFLSDFDGIRSCLQLKLDTIINRVQAEAEKVAHLSDKELGLTLKQYPEDVRSFLFSWRKSQGNFDPKTRMALFRVLRPTGNVLPGYTPSYAMERARDEDFEQPAEPAIQQSEIIAEQKTEYKF